MREGGALVQRLSEHLNLSTWRGAVASAFGVGYSRQPLCGDEVWVDVAVEGGVEGGVIQQARYRGQGCAVSMARWPRGCFERLGDAGTGGIARVSCPPSPLVALRSSGFAI